MASERASMKRMVMNRRTVLRTGAAGLGVLAMPAILRPAFAADELPIGWVLPLTGSLASTYSHLYLPGEIAIAEVNAAGGILGKKLVPVKLDDEGSPAKQPVVIRELMDKGINIIVGPTGSSQTMSALEVTTPAKIIQSCYASADEVGDGTRYPYHYQINFGAMAQAVRHVDTLEALGKKNVGILVDDSAAGDSTRQAVVAELKKRGFNIVSEQIFPIKTTDMTPFLRKLRADGAEALDTHISTNGDATQFFVGLSRIGWKPATVGHTGLLYAGLPGAVPDDSRYEEVYAATYKALTYTDANPIADKVLRFAKALSDAGTPDPLLPLAATSPFYDFVHLLKAVAEKAGSTDSDAMKAAFDSFTGEGFFGTVSFTPERHQGYGPDVLAMAVVNSTNEPVSMESKGLYRRRGPGA